MTSSCAPDPDAFVTFLSGGAYIPGALCLQHALQRFHPCRRLVVVLDDRPLKRLPDATDIKLRSSLLPPNQLVLLTTLFRRLNGARSALYDLVHPVPTGANWSLESELSDPRAVNGSSTPSATHRYLLSWMKVWLWALPGIKRAVFLDGDVLVLRSLDTLFNRSQWPMHGVHPFAAVRANCAGQRSFNSGTFAFEPSLDTATRLVRIAHDSWVKLSSSRWKPLCVCLSLGSSPPWLITT